MQAEAEEAVLDGLFLALPWSYHYGPNNHLALRPLSPSSRTLNTHSSTLSSRSVSLRKASRPLQNPFFHAVSDSSCREEKFVHIAVQCYS